MNEGDPVVFSETANDDNVSSKPAKHNDVSQAATDEEPEEDTLNDEEEGAVFLIPDDDVGLENNTYEDWIHEEKGKKFRLCAAIDKIVEGAVRNSANGETNNATTIEHDLTLDLIEDTNCKNLEGFGGPNECIEMKMKQLLMLERLY
jgi:hypothetical protein